MVEVRAGAIDGLARGKAARSNAPAGPDCLAVPDRTVRNVARRHRGRHAVGKLPARFAIGEELDLALAVEVRVPQAGHHEQVAGVDDVLALQLSPARMDGGYAVELDHDVDVLLD